MFFYYYVILCLLNIYIYICYLDCFIRLMLIVWVFSLQMAHSGYFFFILLVMGGEPPEGSLQLVWCKHITLMEERWQEVCEMLLTKASITSSLSHKESRASFHRACSSLTGAGFHKEAVIFLFFFILLNSKSLNVWLYLLSWRLGCESWMRVMTTDKKIKSSWSKHTLYRLVIAC